MSLTGQLAVGPLAAWCAANLTGTADVATAVATTTRRQCVRERSPVGSAAIPSNAGLIALPIRPSGHVTGREHWATIGGAFGQRLAFAAAHAPPY